MKISAPFASITTGRATSAKLRNVLEYATTINTEALSFQALPNYLRQRSHYVDRHHRGQDLLLKLIFNRQMAGMTTGRRSLKEEFIRRYYPISEMEIRDHLEELRRHQLLRVKRGRAGTGITAAGIQALVTRGIITAPDDPQTADTPPAEA